MNNHAYISFDAALKTSVVALQEQLKKRGFNVHFETSADPEGKDFNKTRELVDTSKVFICCVTRSYAKNLVCLNEIDYAYGTKKPKVVLMFENVSYKDLDHLGFVIAGLPLCMLFEDRDKAYLKGTGPQFEQIIERLNAAVHESTEESDVTSKQYELYICHDHVEATSVEVLARRLHEEKSNIRVSYDHFRYKNKNRKANFTTIKQSKAFLAVLSKGFLKSKVCLEEITYAQRMKLSLFIIMDSGLKLDQPEAAIVNAVMQTVNSNDIIKDLSVLDKSLDKIPFIDKL